MAVSLFGQDSFWQRTKLSVHESQMNCPLKNVGRGWVQTSAPVFSPNEKIMVLTIENQTIIRDISNSLVSAWDVGSEKSLWSWDSSLLAMYTSNRKIFAVRPNAGELHEIYSLSALEELEDWIWFADNQHILLVIERTDGLRQIRVLSITERRLIL
jgi:hypothetical protein